MSIVLGRWKVLELRNDFFEICFCIYYGLCLMDGEIWRDGVVVKLYIYNYNMNYWKLENKSYKWYIFDLDYLYW